MHFPGIMRFWEPPRSLSKALITQVKHWEWFASQISWVHIRFEYKKEKNWACFPLLPFSVKTEHFQFFSYLFRIVHYFNSQHPVSKSPAETTCKTQQFPDCKCHETLVLCSRQTSQLIKMHWWEKETTGKSRVLGLSQGRKWKNKTNILHNKVQQSCGNKQLMDRDLGWFSCEQPLNLRGGCSVPCACGDVAAQAAQKRVQAPSTALSGNECCTGGCCQPLSKARGGGDLFINLFVLCSFSQCLDSMGQEVKEILFF